MENHIVPVVNQILDYRQIVRYPLNMDRKIKKQNYYISKNLLTLNTALATNIMNNFFKSFLFIINILYLNYSNI